MLATLPVSTPSLNTPSRRGPLAIPYGEYITHGSSASGVATVISNRYGVHVIPQVVKFQARRLGVDVTA